MTLIGTGHGYRCNHVSVHVYVLIHFHIHVCAHVHVYVIFMFMCDFTMLISKDNFQDTDM
jgi:hypothetical protein